MHGLCSCDVNTVFPGLAAIVAGVEGNKTDIGRSCISYGVPGVFPPRGYNCAGLLANPAAPNGFVHISRKPRNLEYNLIASIYNDQLP